VSRGSSWQDTHERSHHLVTVIAVPASPGLPLSARVVPLVDVLRRVSLRINAMP
jgi:hypothetical protein